MTKSRSALFALLPFMTVALGGRHASAIALPDSSSCNSAECFKITNTKPGTGTGIYGVAAGYGIIGIGSIGTYGYSSNANGTGVRGDADNNGVGIAGYAVNNSGAVGSSETNNGVRGYTASTTAAAISALSPSSSGLAFYGTGGIQITGSFAQKAGGGAWTSPSDVRIKKDIKDLEWGIDELSQVRTVTFKYNGLGGSDNDGRQYVGVIAQELEKIFPSMVTARKAKLHSNDATETDIRVVDPSALTYVLINSVKEQQQIIAQQDKRIAALERTRAPLGASTLGGSLGTGITLGLLLLAVVALRRRRKSLALA